MNENNIIQLDVVPIYKNEIYPTKKEIWHLKNDGNVPREIKLEYMFVEIEHKFFDSDCIVIIENGKVLEIIGGNKK